MVSVSAIPNEAVNADLPAVLRPLEAAGLSTRQLLERAVGSGYTGEPWEELTRRLVTRALPDLELCIRSGAIYLRCARSGCAIAACPELQRPPSCREIAAEAVELCLERFESRVLPMGQWDPEQGTSLEDFFAVCCISEVPNRWRWHLNRLTNGAIELDALDEPGRDLIFARDAGELPDPAEIVELRDELARVGQTLSQADRLTFVLKEYGWRPAEIARELGVERNTLDARISRARKNARAGRQAQ